MTQPTNLPPEVPPGLAAYYAPPGYAPNGANQPRPLAPAPPPTHNERLGLRLALLIGAWLLIPLAIIYLIIRSITSGPTTVNVGEPAVAAPWQLVVNSVQKPGKTLPVNNATISATGSWWVVEVTLKNTGTQATNISVDSFVLKDSKGAFYSFDGNAYQYVTSRNGQSLTTSVPANGSIHSFLVYDVPTDATGLQLVFQQGNQPQVNLGS